MASLQEFNMSTLDCLSEADSLLAGRISSLRNWSSHLSSTSAMGLQDSSMMAGSLFASRLDRPGTAQKVDHLNHDRSDHLSDDDRFQQRFITQLEAYKKELAMLRERTGEVVTENQCLQHQVDSAATQPGHCEGQSSIAPNTGATTLKTEQVTVHPTDTHRKMISENAEQGRQKKPVSQGIPSGTESHPISSAQPSATTSDTATLPESDAHVDELMSDTSSVVDLAAITNWGGGRNIARVEVELARCRKDNDRLKQTLEDVNQRLAQALWYTSQLEARLSVQEEHYKEQEEELKAQVPSLCIECGQRQALVSQPISTVHIQQTAAVTTVTRERDEALSWVKKLEGRVHQHCESESNLQLQVQSLTMAAKASAEEHHRLKLETAKLRQALQANQESSTARLESLRKELSASAENRSMEWERERIQLGDQVARHRTVQCQLEEGKSTLVQQLKQLEHQLKTEQHLHLSERQRQKEHAEQGSKDQRRLEVKLAESQVKCGDAMEQLRKAEDSFRKEAVDFKQQLTVIHTQSASLQSALNTSQERCVELEALMLRDKQNSLAAQADTHDVIHKQAAEVQRLTALNRCQVAETEYKQDQLQRHIASLEESLKRAAAHQHLESQQWRARYQQIKESSEAENTNLRERCSHNQERVETLSMECQQQASNTAVLTDDVKNWRRQCRKLDKALKQSEAERLHWQHQVHVLLQKQRDLMLERRQLSQNLEQLVTRRQQASHLAGADRLDSTGDDFDQGDAQEKAES